MPNYGKAVSFEFPSSLNVYGPAQVEAAINQDPAISAQRTLWGQEGSTVIFGNLLTVPIGNSLLFVPPLYLQSSQPMLPQIQRIIVFYRSPSATPDLPTGQQQNVAMAPTLGEALTAIFGGTPPAGTQPGTGGTTTPTTTPTTSTTAQLIAQANAEYAAAQAALRAGDLVGFAQQIDALGKTYKLTAKIPAGLIKHKVEFYSVTGGSTNLLNTVTDIVCGDAYIIDGQSNALATDNVAPNDPSTDPWMSLLSSAYILGHAGS
jgi:uncharacterized membrane protein (UPF0182 family)